ncbi:peptidase family C25 [Longilinea arvoryzae]|uniref:Peptidase family C25 n=1 Tax=Longilinea arvoryzae TaxID=360412 RepID=A0A0S7BE67_9CHLR|nr:C25 family cysteine peptidase [Longilinea arvoryzae]GAP13721.1 peptidase family C25 [Longilinea arvoryzae]
MPDEKKIFINGIDGVTGQYLLPPMNLANVAALARGETRDQNLLDWLSSVWHKISTPHLGLPLGVDPADVTQAGWGIVFLKDADLAVIAALQPLIEHRKQRIRNDRIVKELDYRPGESWEAWLDRYGVAPGSVDPTRVPYYLLLVGDPARMPFEFGQLLDVEYGVGRLHFDTPGEYAAYAASVIDYENGQTLPNRKEAVFFGTRHPFDAATQMSADHLVGPLADGIPEAGQVGLPAQWGYLGRKLMATEATKAGLLNIIRPAAGSKPPAFLFTASHGMGFPRGHVRQKSQQGALLCQDWRGLGNISSDDYFAGADVPADARVHGMVIFHFACYGGGTPDRDLFVHEAGQKPPVIADSPFLAALPKAWLAHPGGGALACIGHVERAWGTSIISGQAGPQILTFQNAIGRILIGQPLGYALKDFNERYAALSTGISAALQKAGWGDQIDADALATNWIERNDAEGYVLIGDPAVRLRADDLTV